MKIGDQVYVFDINHRVYRRDENGKSFGGPIYRDYFVSVTIAGETKRSWIVSRYGAKLPKKPLHILGGCLTKQQVIEQVWMNEHRFTIIRTIERQVTYEQLRRIAEVIGMEAIHDSPPADDPKAV